MRRLQKAAFLLVLLCFVTAAAQDDTCSDIVTQALSAVEETCALTGRNQACYGNFSMQVTLRENAPALRFEQQGDVIDVIDLQTLVLRELNVEENTWGIALMQIQADLPDALPGQNVTFLLFGDVEIENAVDPNAQPAPSGTDLNPMQAFYFRTGVNSALNCAEAPTDGMLIQTPEGVGEISLRANDVDIRLGSTAFLRAEAGEAMTVSVLEGQAEVTAQGQTVIVPAGAWASVPIDEDLSATDVPGEPQPYSEDELSLLPIELLPDDFEIAPAADDEMIQDVQDDLHNDDDSAGDPSDDSGGAGNAGDDVGGGGGDDTTPPGDDGGGDAGDDGGDDTTPPGDDGGGDDGGGDDGGGG